MPSMLLRRARRAFIRPIPAMCLGVANVAFAQGVRLQIRPHVGDTLRMRLDQATEMTGTRKGAASESSSSMTTSLRVYTRAVVEGSSTTSTTLVTYTDSAFVATGEKRQPSNESPLGVAGMKVRVRVMPDGTVEMADANASLDASETLALIPAALPKETVEVGSTWKREMTLPTTSSIGRTPGGRLTASFHLDSLTRGGDLAYISLRGEMLPDEHAERSALAPRLDKGVVTGTLLLDRKRGWLTDSRFDISVQSTLVPPTAGDSTVMHFTMRVTQRMRTLDRK
jgi:hypothetical protein